MEYTEYNFSKTMRHNEHIMLIYGEKILTIFFTKKMVRLKKYDA